MFSVWVHLLRNLALLNRLSTIKCCIITGVSIVTRSSPKSIVFYRFMASIDPKIEMIDKPETYHREQRLNWSSQEWVLTEDSDFHEWIGCALLTSVTYKLKATSRILQASVLAQTIVYWCIWTAYRNCNSANLNFFFLLDLIVWVNNPRRFNSKEVFSFVGYLYCLSSSKG